MRGVVPKLPPRRVGLAVKLSSPEAIALGKEFLRELERRGIEGVADAESAGVLGVAAGPLRAELGRHVDAVVVLGGDGTFLSVSRGCPTATPVAGVNMGTLGFLTEHSREQAFTLLDDLAGGPGPGRAARPAAGGRERPLGAPGVPGAQRRRDQQGGARPHPHDQRGDQRRVPVALPRRRADPRDSDRFHRVQPVRRRSDRPPGAFRAAHHARSARTRSRTGRWSCRSSGGPGSGWTGAARRST